MFSRQLVNNENKLNNTLSLTIRLSNTLTVPITINSLSPANDIIDIIGKFILFQNKPILFFKGKHVQPYISLKAQGIKTGDEIVIYDKLITSLININSQLKFDPIKKTNQDIANFKKWQNTKFLSEHDLLEKTYVCVLNEIKRLVDQWFTNLENIFPDSVLYADLMEEEDSNEQQIDDSNEDANDDSIVQDKITDETIEKEPLLFYTNH